MGTGFSKPSVPISDRQRALIPFACRTLTHGATVEWPEL